MIKNNISQRFDLSCPIKAAVFRINPNGVGGARIISKPYYNITFISSIGHITAWPHGSEYFFPLFGAVLDDFSVPLQFQMASAQHFPKQDKKCFGAFFVNIGKIFYYQPQDI